MTIGEPIPVVWQVTEKLVWRLGRREELIASAEMNVSDMIPVIPPREIVEWHKSGNIVTGGYYLEWVVDDRVVLSLHWPIIIVEEAAKQLAMDPPRKVTATIEFELPTSMTADTPDEWPWDGIIEQMDITRVDFD